MLRIWMCVLLAMGCTLAMAEEPAVDAGMAALRAEAADERARSEEIGRLQFEVERLKLELEKKKTAAELGRVEGVPAAQSIPSGGTAAPVLRYVFMAGECKEAVFDAGGVEARASEGGRAAGLLVKSISADKVVAENARGEQVVLSTEK